jgi:hypothetical protein
MYTIELHVICPDGKKIGCKVDTKDLKDTVDAMPKMVDAVQRKLEDKAIIEIYTEQITN